jgi:hypothetical protein
MDSMTNDAATPPTPQDELPLLDDDVEPDEPPVAGAVTTTAGDAALVLPDESLDVTVNV